MKVLIIAVLLAKYQKWGQNLNAKYWIDQKSGNLKNIKTYG